MKETKKTTRTAAKAEPVKEAVKAEAAKVESAVKSAAEKAKPAVKAAAEKAKPVVKAAKEKAAPVVKAAEKKAAAAKAAVSGKAASEAKITVQFDGKSYATEDLVRIAKDVWKYDLGREEKEFKSVELFVKPEESTVYYVINEDVLGNFKI